MICPKTFLILRICAFFIIDFSCYLFVRFLGSICKFGGKGSKYINLRAKIKIHFVNIHTSIFFFSKAEGGHSKVEGGHAPLSPWVVPSLIHDHPSPSIITNLGVHACNPDRYNKTRKKNAVNNASTTHFYTHFFHNYPM